MDNSISDLSVNIATRMLAAMTYTPTATNNDATYIYDIPLCDQKKYLKNNIDRLSLQDRIAIGDILVKNCGIDILNWCNDGTVVNLDILPDYVINKIYEYMATRMYDYK
jgi:hypothetical protein